MIPLIQAIKHEVAQTHMLIYNECGSPLYSPWQRPQSFIKTRRQALHPLRQNGMEYISVGAAEIASLVYQMAFQ